MKSWDEIHKATATFSKRWKNATDSVSLVREWLYNRRSELTVATVGTNLYGYSYDTIGNRLWSAANVATNEYAANALNQYTSVGGSAPDAPQTTFAYDADGNMTRDGRFLYSYDAENRLRSITARSATNGSLRVLNAYDHRNRRIRKTLQQLHLSVAQPPALPVEIREWQTLETHTFVWDDNNIVLEKVDFADGTTRTFEYFWGMDKSGTEQGAGGVGGLLAVSMDGMFYIPCYDHNGNIVLYVSETGGIAAQYTYDPYGNIIESSAPLAEVFSFGFSTKCHDREIGMVGYKRRFLRPDLGRWLNRDPIEEEGGENLYAFCKNNTVSSVDPCGLDRYMTTFSADLRKDQWHVGVAVDTWKCSDGKWIKTGVVTFDFCIDDTSFWNRLGTFFVTIGTIVESDGNNLIAPFTIPSTPKQDIEMLNRIRSEIGNPPFYSFFFNNCIHWAIEVIDYGKFK